MSSLLNWLVENESSFSKSRLPSLYSDLIQQKAANPDGFTANCEAWQSALSHAALAGQLPSGDRTLVKVSDDLLSALSTPAYGRPSGLGLVFDEAVKKRKFVDLKDFETSEKSIYQKSWVPSPWAVLKWGLKQAGVLSESSFEYNGHLRSGSLVVVDNLEELARQVALLQGEGSADVTSRILTREDFTQRLADKTQHKLSTTDLNLLLHYLSRDTQSLSYDATTIKLNHANSNLPPDPITPEDHTIANLKSLMASLSAQTQVLTQRVSEQQAKAQDAVLAKNKHGALSALRSKKLAETSLQQRSATLEQLEGVFAKIQQAHDQAQMVQVMKDSTGVLRNLNKQTGGVDRVDEIMADLREQMGEVDEVGQIIQEPLGASAELVDSEVDEELARMEKEHKEQEEQKEALATQAKLQELEKVEAEARVRAPAKQAEEKTSQATVRNDNVTDEQIDALLHDSTERLKTVHIEDEHTGEVERVRVHAS